MNTRRPTAPLLIGLTMLVACGSQEPEEPAPAQQSQPLTQVAAPPSSDQPVVEVVEVRKPAAAAVSTQLQKQRQALREVQEMREQLQSELDAIRQQLRDSDVELDKKQRAVDALKALGIEVVWRECYVTKRRDVEELADFAFSKFAK